MDSKSSRVIVSPSLLYSGGVSASRSMSEEFNYVYMHLFDDENHEKSMPEVQKGEKRPAFIDSDEDNDVEDLLLLASQVYELEARLEGAAKGSPTIKGVPEVSKELQSTGKVEYPCISIAIAPYFQANRCFQRVIPCTNKIQ